MASFFDEIAQNRLKSVLMMLVFVAFFSLVVYVFVLFLGGGILSFIIGFALILVYAAVVYFYGDRMTLKMSGAKEADRKQYHSLYSIVEGLSSATQVKTPRVYIVDDPSPNAFATGRNQKVSAIAVTSGLLSMMDKRELQGVIAHEMSHIANNDVQFMMIAIIFAGVIGLIAAMIRNVFWFGGFRGGGRDNEGAGLIVIVALVIGVLGPIFAMLVQLAISRKREYLADANGARITRDPRSLASALTKLKNYSANPQARPVRAANEVNAPMYFTNPLNSANMMALFSTHPPIDERITRLNAMY